MIDSLPRIYSEVPSIVCQRKCQQACGPILMSEVELVRISSVGTPPTPHPETLACSKLRGGECSIYSIRPLICRLWGVAAGMECPWGCRPERKLSRKAAYGLIDRAERLG
jgi:Fe-S-cluster containining protein